MPSGGRRAGAGRKPGSVNHRPQRGSKLERQIDEYKATVLGGVPFKGDSLELLRAVYRGDYNATHDQIYAAVQVLRFEHLPAVTADGRSVEQIKEEVRKELEGDPEENKVKLHEVIAEFVRYGVRETVRRLRGHAKYPTPHPAWVCDEVDQIIVQIADTLDFPIGGVVDKALAEPDVARASEITPPQMQVGFRKRQPVEIDGQECGCSGEEMLKPAGTAGVGRNKCPPHAASTASPPTLQNRPAPTAIVVVAPPFAHYQARSGRRYAADERGEIAIAHTDDAEDLLRAGCRRGS